MLEPNYLKKHFPSRVTEFHELPLAIRIYLSILDGECQVERDLAETRGFLRETKNGDDEYLDDFLLVRIGNVKATDVAERSGDVAVPRRLCFEWVKLWRAIYGCKYGVTYTKRKVKKQSKKVGTFRCVRKAALQAARKCREVSEANGALQKMTAYGVPAGNLSFYGQRKEDFGQWNAKLNKFATRTGQIRSLNMCMSHGKKGFPKWKCKPA